jgi:hypothetical protein
VAALASPIPACDAPAATEVARPGHIRLALDAATCANHCVTTLRVTLYEDGFDDLPLGPATETTCGDTLTITDLPAGLPLRVRVDAFDAVGQSLLSGLSELVTVQSGRAVEAAVPLAALSPPVITSVTPDPWVAATDALVVEGTAFAPRGAFGLALDATALAATFVENAAVDPADPERTFDRITVSPRGDTSGDSLVVTACGVASEPFPVRVVGATIGAEILGGAPTCPGATPVAAAVTPGRDTLLVAWTCSDPSLASLHVHDLGGATCPPPLRAVHPLGARPTALAVTDTHAVVALDGGGFVHVAGPTFVGTPQAVVLPEDPPDLAAATVVGAAATDDAVLVPVVVAGSPHILAFASDGAATIRAPGFPELTPQAVAATAETVWMLATTASGDTRLVVEPAEGAPTASPVACVDPAALVVSPDGQRLALRCADATVFWTPSDGALERIGVADAIAFDTLGDVSFAALAESPGVTLLGAAGNTVVTWSNSFAPWLDLGEHRLLVVEPSLLQVKIATPFDTRGPCAEGGWR